MIALTFIKKMFRSSRTVADKLKDVSDIIYQIENGSKANGIKE